MGTEERAGSVTINLRAILLLVIAAALGLIVFTKILVRSKLAATAIPQVTRGPLKKLTPPLTANKIGLLADLKARRFDKLQRQLDAYQQQAERDIAQEANVRLAVEAFNNNDPEVGPLLSEWASKAPGSYSAHLALAESLFSRGWEARGSKSAAETSEQQFSRMRDLFATAVHEAQTALSLNPKVSQAYALLLGEEMADAGVRSCLAAGAPALKQVPASYDIRAQIMTCLEPRWGGSYEAMEQFARSSQAFVRENPLLATLKGFPDFDRASYLYASSQYGPAIRLYTRAIKEGGDHAGFYRERGAVFNAVGRYQDAIEDLRRADQLWPQYPATLESLAFTLSAFGKNQDALQELKIDAAVGGPSPYAEQLRTAIMMKLRKGSEG